jgi:hypothetical protein
LQIECNKIIHSNTKITKIRLIAGDFLDYKSSNIVSLTFWYKGGTGIQDYSILSPAAVATGAMDCCGRTWGEEGQEIRRSFTEKRKFVIKFMN